MDAEFCDLQIQEQQWPTPLPDVNPIRKKSGDNPRCFGRIFLIRGNIPTINGDLTLQSKLEIRKGGDFQFTSRIQKFQSQISHDPL